MAKKLATRYVCSSCGLMTTSWSGKCQQCGEWNTLAEQLTPATIAGSVADGNILTSQSVTGSVKVDQPRISTSIKEVDDVFGGGIVSGSVNLIAGQPGIGKSTLLLQMGYAVAAKVPVLYVSGEESLHQIL